MSGLFWAAVLALNVWGLLDDDIGTLWRAVHAAGAVGSATQLVLAIVESGAA